MLLNSDYIYPIELTGYIRTALADMQMNRFSLSAFLPNRTVDDIEFRAVTGGTGLAEAASYRSWDAEAPIGGVEALKMIRGEIPPISRKIRLGEYDRLRTRHLPQRIVDAIYDDANRLAQSVAARVELARSQALVEGKVTIDDENGLTGFTADFGRDASMTVSAAASWATSSTDILSDLMTWRDAYVDLNGEDPQAILTSYKVLNLMLRNDTVRNQIWPVAGTQPSIVTEAAVNQLLASQGLPNITINRSRVRVNGTAQYVVPENDLLFLPAPTAADNPAGTQLGETQWGTTAEAMENGYGMVGTGNEPGIVGGFYTEEDPVSGWTKVAAVSLPILANPNLSMCATVVL